MSMVIGKSYIKPDDKDVTLAHEIAEAWYEGRCPEIEGSRVASVHSNPQYILSSYIEYALTAARKDARAAERKRLALIVQSLPATASGAGTFKESAIKAIEAAANTEQGAGDG